MSKKKRLIEIEAFQNVPSEKETFKLPALTAKNEGQKDALKTIYENKVSFIHGVPGSGKSHIALAYGIIELLRGNYSRIVLTRPYIEAGEKLGFLPGSFDDKIAPFMMPLYDIMSKYLTNKQISDFTKDKKIIIIPLAYMRGLTFNDSYVLADEMQNATPQQIRLLLTRLGDKTKIVLTGDTSQSDLHLHEHGKNGLEDAITRLKNMDHIGISEMLYDSTVRDPLVGLIDEKYRK